jgi:hypothetical protein
VGVGMGNRSEGDGSGGWVDNGRAWQLGHKAAPAAARRYL